MLYRFNELQVLIQIIMLHTRHAALDAFIYSYLANKSGLHYNLQFSFFLENKLHTAGLVYVYSFMYVYHFL
jgi:hypothetical protein